MPKKKNILTINSTQESFRHPEDFRKGAVARSAPARKVPVGRYSAGTPNNPSELNSGSINGERSEHMEKITDQSQEVSAQNSKSKSGLRPPLIDSGSESGMTLSREEIAQGVDSCESLTVPLRDDREVSLSLRNKGNHRGWFRSNGPADVCAPVSRACEGERVKGEGATLKSSEVNALPKERNELIDSSSYRPNDFPSIDSGSESGMTLRGSLENNELFCHSERSEGGRRPLLDLETTQDFSRHPELDSGSINGGRSPHITTCHRAFIARSQKAAFTLAEVLITLSVIGIVAALTIPNLIQNHNEKAWSTAQSVFEKKLEIAARQMNTEEKLAGYSSTKDFVNELKKYIKITRVCDNDELTKCFAKEVIWNQGEDPIDMSTIKTAKNLGQEDWDTDTVGVQFANGVNAIIAYNPNTTQDPYNNQFGATSNSMAILYDVSGNKNPNTNGKDIGKINVESLGGVTGCMIDPSLVGDMCITQILAPGSGYSPMTKAECEQAVSDGQLGIEQCSSESDYWAGAVKACKGIQNLPNQAQLTALAQYVYNESSINSSGYTYDVALDSKKASQFLSASPGQSDGYFRAWSGEGASRTRAYYRLFDSTGTNWNNYYRNNSDYIAVCLGEQ